MTLELELRAHSFAGRLRTFWATFSKTVIGDLIATVVAIVGMSALFLACAFAMIGLMHAGRVTLRILGGG